jgi:phosphoglycolate phosphatase
VARPAKVTAYDVVLLDLDGTLIDSVPGVQESVRYGLEGFGIDPTQDELAEFLGPPLSDVLPRVFGITDPADIQSFLDRYCEAYFHGAEYDYAVYPGMPEIVVDLASAGTTLGLATAKPHESAARILAHAGLAQHFTVIAGSETDGSRQDKAEVIEHALTALVASRHSQRMVMVGDRAIDIRAAREHSIGAVAVAWGYASAGELEDCGATHLVVDPASLRRILLP